MLLKPKIIIDDKVTYSRVSYLREGICHRCMYNSVIIRNRDCRVIKINRGITLMTYCTNSIITKFRLKGKIWNYVITEKE